jgi:ATP-dependent protease HslVU (ClpYQ) peptidase subunit
VLIDGEADFTALVLTRKGLFEYGKYCRAERVLEPFYAIGSGCKAALGAMHMGADARRAVQVACKVDTYSGTPIVVMEL